MDEINDILNNLGIETSNPPEEPSYFSESDISEIINENAQEEETQEEPTAIDSEFDFEELMQETQLPSPHAEETEHTEVEESVEEESTEEENTPASEEVTSEEVNKIPLNSPTLLIDESTSRFSGTEWYNEIQKSRVIIAGVGGIGSNVAFQLARMTPASIVLYDDDRVETVNMAGQLFSRDDVGKLKVNAMANMICNYTNSYQVMAVADRFTELTEAGNIMICGFDNMRARKTFFNSWCRHLDELPDEKKYKCLFIDGRLSIDTLQVFCIKGDDSYNKHRYKKEFLFNDSEADETICSMKQTTYLACMIGSIMVNMFTNFIANKLNPIIPYDLPFFVEYDAQNVIFKTES